MEVDYDLLHRIHNTLILQAELVRKKERGPRQIVIAQNAEKKIDEEVTTAQETLKKAKLSSSAKQLQLDEREAKIKDLGNKLNTADSNKEFQLLKDRIAADEQANSVLSDEILEQLEKIDVLEANLKTAKENLETATSETKKIIQKIKDQDASLETHLVEVAENLKQLESQLEGDYVAAYRRLIAGRGEDGLAETDMETCGGCHTKFNTQTLSQLMMRKAVFCGSCQCLMYFTKETSAALPK